MRGWRFLTLASRSACRRSNFACADRPATFGRAALAATAPGSTGSVAVSGSAPADGPHVGHRKVFVELSHHAWLVATIALLHAAHEPS